jgi:2-oxoglutarate ferredoxin oxidoreductase subunit gamma
MHKIFFAGFGGQGILSAGQMLAQAGMDEGFHVTVFFSYGPEQRGGTSLCMTLLSEDEVCSPVASTPNVLVALNQPSLESFEPKVDEGGKVLINSSLATMPRAGRKGVRYWSVPCSDIATELGDVRAANVVALGALIEILGVVSAERQIQAVREIFSNRNPAVLDLNLRAIQKGREAAKRGEQ